ncbi:MAG: hypothetical protein KY462_14335 [Actinobacteria bacterium]|nr:hypothetical protein [Actinomycetota bacterium]
MGGRAVRVGAVIVAAVVLFGVGAAIGRATAPSGPVSAAPTQDAGMREPPASSDPGPSTTVGGVPVGYERSREGAVAAAANYAVVLDSPAVLDSERLASVLQRVAEEDARADLTERFTRIAALLEERLSLDATTRSDAGFVMRSVPAGYRILDYSDDEATVAIWGTSVFVAAGRQAVAPAWGTTELSLRWEDGDWRVLSIDTEEGPTPPLPGNAENAALVGAQINRFEPFWHRPATEG